eukprot:1007665-Amphidinium_carterae.1
MFIRCPGRRGTEVSPGTPDSTTVSTVHSRHHEGQTTGKGESDRLQNLKFFGAQVHPSIRRLPGSGHVSLSV